MKNLLIILSVLIANLVSAQTGTATLNGSASSDSDGTISAYLWTKISGPSCTITSPNSAITTVTGLVVGVYKFELKVTDNNNPGATDRDTMQITVLAGNKAPNANAGPDQTIQLPGATALLNGSGNDPEGGLLTYNWTKVSGAGNQTIVSPNTAQTQVTGFNKEGTYIFRLTVTDSAGATGTDDVNIFVIKKGRGRA